MNVHIAFLAHETKPSTKNLMTFTCGTHTEFQTLEVNLLVYSILYSCERSELIRFKPYRMCAVSVQQK